MRIVTAILLGLLMSISAFCQQNRVVKLDGVDNYLPMGMGQLKDNWTLEAWIKGDGNKWNDLEAVIGAGYYAELNTSDHMALVIKDGRLHNNGANISSPKVLPANQWLHVAAMSDGETNPLSLDKITLDLS